MLHTKRKCSSIHHRSSGRRIPHYQPGRVAGGQSGRRRPGWRRDVAALDFGLPGVGGAARRLPWPPAIEEGAGCGGGPAVEAGCPAEGAAARERRRPGGAGPSVGGAGGRGEEKTTWRWLGGMVAGSISVAAVEGGGGGRQRRGRRSILRLDAFQSQKAMNRRPHRQRPDLSKH